MSEDPFPSVGIDWKFVGRDYLRFFPEKYPSLDFLSGAPFDALCDELAHEAAETCFEGISGFLGPFGYQLWNIDTGGDEYLLVIVADGAVDDFRAAVLADCDADFVPECERLAPAAPPWIAPSKPQPTSSGKRKDIVAETDHHLSYGSLGVGTDLYKIIDFEDEDGSVLSSLVDVRTFPLAGVDAEGLFDLIEQKHHFSGVHTTDGGQYWRWEKPQKRQKLYTDRVFSIAFATGYQVLEIAEVANMVWRDGAYRSAWGIGNTLYLHTLYEGDPERFNSDAPVFGSPPTRENERAAVFAINGLTARHIVTMRCKDSLVPVSETEILIFFCDNPDQTESHTRYALFDCVKGAAVTQGRLPFALSARMDGVFPLNADEFAYVRLEVREHPTHPQLTEKVGWLVRFNARTGTWCEARLDGLHNDFVINMAILRNQAPDKHRVRSFDGFLELRPGHDGWCILNYQTAQSGKHDLAWFWNVANDEVLKIRQRDFPSRTPTFRYNSTRGRYIADDGCRLDLLIPFAEIYAMSDHDRLIWTR
jgi:hypothetical protein